MMSVKQINKFIRFATKKEKELVKEECGLTPRQAHIFELRFNQDKSIDYIADILGYGRSTIDSELKTIRKKTEKLL